MTPYVARLHAGGPGSRQAATSLATGDWAPSTWRGVAGKGQGSSVQAAPSQQALKPAVLRDRSQADRLEPKRRPPDSADVSDELMLEEGRALQRGCLAQICIQIFEKVCGIALAKRFHECDDCRTVLSLRDSTPGR